mmetsp:Transcript_12224/g.51425  ORF Transcript_12224/g.51425 Transcript_12224/m.51425 type:complete len:262 (-) Transcript_12224:1008-1793(-)
MRRARSEASTRVEVCGKKSREPHGRRSGPHEKLHTRVPTIIRSPPSRYTFERGRGIPSRRVPRNVRRHAAPGPRAPSVVSVPASPLQPAGDAARRPHEVRRVRTPQRLHEGLAPPLAVLRRPQVTKRVLRRRRHRPLLVRTGPSPDCLDVVQHDRRRRGAVRGSGAIVSRVIEPDPRVRELRQLRQRRPRVDPSFVVPRQRQTRFAKRFNPPSVALLVPPPLQPRAHVLAHRRVDDAVEALATRRDVFPRLAPGERGRPRR